jgi:hypothetical protein
VARDVEFNVTASDKTGNALNAAARAFERTQKRITSDHEKAQAKIRGDADKAFAGLGGRLLSAVGAVSPKLAEAITGSVASAGKAAGPLLVGAIAASAPFIGATVSAAVVGGAGIGGVVGGMVLASRDPRVKAAGKELGDDLLGSLTDAARPFVPAMIAATHQVRAGFADIEDDLKRIFANSSKFVGPLTTGVVTLARQVVAGVDAVVAKAGPTIDALSEGLAGLGGDIRSFMTTVAGDGRAAAEAVRSLFQTMSGLIRITGLVVAGLTRLYNLSNSVLPSLLQIAGRFNEAAPAAGTFSTAIGAVVAGVQAAIPPVESYTVQMQELAQAQRDAVASANTLYAAQTSSAKAFRDAKAAVAEHGKGMSLNTAAGIANRETLSNLSTSLNATYDAYVRVNGAGEGANDVMRSNRQKFIEVATAATGSAAAAARLADKLLGVPSIKPKVELLDNATGKINNVINRMAAVRSKTVTLNIAVRQSGDAAALAKQSRTDFSAASYASAGPAAGSHRTGGPTPVQVSSAVSVYLDGQPFAQQTTRVVEQSQQRREWRAKVGTR